MLQDLTNCSKNDVLLMNMNKAQVMTNSRLIPIRVNLVELQYVSKYIYLDKELKRIITLEWKAFGSLKFTLLGKKLNCKVKFEALELFAEFIVRMPYMELD